MSGTIERTHHIAIARSLFRRLLVKEKDWQALLLNPGAYQTREEVLAAVDELDPLILWMPPCDKTDASGKCLGHGNG